MFGLGKMFGKKRAALDVKIAKVQNKDLMEAIIGAAVLVAHADGDCSDEELTVLQGVIETNDNLKHFGSDIGVTLDSYCAKYKASKRMAKVALMKEITDVKADEEEKVQVMIIAIDIADADGNIDEDEMKVLKDIGRALGLNPDLYI